MNIADVYDDEALKRVHPTLSFLKEVDKRSGYRTKQMLVVPILDGEALHGVLQVINNKSDQPFGELEVEGAAQLCKTLATAIRQRMHKAEEGARRKATKYDGLVTDGVLTGEELQQCIQSAREEAKPVEHMLMAQYQSDRRRSDRHWPNSSAWLMRLSTAVAFAPRCCMGRSSGISWWSRVGYRWKNHQKAWS